MDQADAGSSDPAPLHRRKRSRWPGVALSLLVPGFGLYRAGMRTHAIGWYLGMEAFNLGVILTSVLSAIPLYVALPLMSFAMMAKIAMLVESFRPGKMNTQKWGVFVVMLLITLCFGLFCRQIGRPFVIPTKSMEPTLTQGDCIMASHIFYLMKPLKRGEVVVFRSEGLAGTLKGNDYARRVAAFAGETVRIKAGAFFVNDKPMSVIDGLPKLVYTNAPLRGAKLFSEASTYLVPDGEVFVLGDNLPESADSRLWGGIPLASIYGSAMNIYFPFSRYGPIK